MWREELLSQHTAVNSTSVGVRALSLPEIARRSSTRRATRAQEDIARKQVSNTAAGRDSAARAAGVGRERVQSSDGSPAPFCAQVLHRAMQTPQMQNVAAMPAQQPQGSQPAPFCGVPGTELAAMAQAAWGQMEGNAQPVPAGQPGPMPEQPSISLSAQAELELELSLRGSLLVQQQRRIVQLEDELQRAWAEIDRLRTKIAAVERERQRSGVQS